MLSTFALGNLVEITEQVSVLAKYLPGMDRRPVVYD